MITEEASAPGEGRFLAYADGRLRINFEDRTILHMNAAGSFCKVGSAPSNPAPGWAVQGMLCQAAALHPT